ncbi:MAG: hypothetical protein RR359_04235 [Bacilli bacterium]
MIDNKSSGIFINRINKDSNEMTDIFISVNKIISDIIANIGILIAEGTHEDLLNKCQEYRQLYKTEVEK